jgi:hypothetical protein
VGSLTDSFNLGDVLSDMEARTPDGKVGDMPTGLLDSLRVGLVGEMADWMDACAIREQRTASTIAALCVCGALYGRAYETESQLRTNLYAIVVIQSGGGKESARQCAKNLLGRAGVNEIIGAEEIGSGAGLLEQFESSPVQLMLIDEIGKLIDKIGNTRAGSWERDIGTALMRLHSSCNTTYTGKALRGGKVHEIDQPHGVLYGTTTPQVYDGLSGGDTLSGFLNRILVFPGHRSIPPIQKRKCSPHRPPDSLVADVRYAWAQNGRTLAGDPDGGNLSGVTATPKPFTVPYGPGAEDVILQMDQELIRRADRGEPSEMWARLMEQGMRIALIRALSRDQRNPIILAEDAQCGADIATWSVSRLSEDVSDRVADGTYERAQKMVARVVKDEGLVPSGVSKSRITKRTPTLGRQMRDEAIAHLLETGEIEEVLGPSMAGSGRRGIYYRPSVVISH